MKQWTIEVAMMAAAFVIVRAMPMAVTTEFLESGLFLRTGDGPTTISLSSITDTIFGQNTHNYDYIIYSEPERAIEATHQFADAWANGNQNDILVAFLNATMSGYMTPQQAADKQWLCNELYTSMQPYVEACNGIQERGTTEIVVIEAGSQWLWSAATKHVATAFAFNLNVLASVLGNAISNNLPNFPRSICAKGGRLSWSKTETFQTCLAQQMVEDVPSMQGNGNLGPWKHFD